MAGASRALWKLWSDFRNLRIENDLIKRQKRIDEFNNLTQIVIQRSVLKKFCLSFKNIADILVWPRHLIGFENDSTGPGFKKMSTNG